MISHKDISYGAFAGAIISIIFSLGNIIRLGYLWDQILIPLIFLSFKQKRKSMPMIWSAIVACIILFGYKFYLGFFVFAYYLIAEAVYYFGGKINLKSLVIVSFVYIIGYFGAWILISHYIHNVDFISVVYQLTGAKFQNTFAITSIIILEPILFSFCYLQLFDIIKRVKILND